MRANFVEILSSIRLNLANVDQFLVAACSLADDNPTISRQVYEAAKDIRSSALLIDHLRSLFCHQRSIEQQQHQEFNFRHQEQQQQQQPSISSNNDNNNNLSYFSYSNKQTLIRASKCLVANVAKILYLIDEIILRSPLEGNGGITTTNTPTAYNKHARDSSRNNHQQQQQQQWRRQQQDSSRVPCDQNDGRSSDLSARLNYNHQAEAAHHAAAAAAPTLSGFLSAESAAVAAAAAAAAAAHKTSTANDIIKMRQQQQQDEHQENHHHRLNNYIDDRLDNVPNYSQLLRSFGEFSIDLIDLGTCIMLARHSNERESRCCNAPNCCVSKSVTLNDILGRSGIDRPSSRPLFSDEEESLPVQHIQESYQASGQQQRQPPYTQGPGLRPSSSSYSMQQQQQQQQQYLSNAHADNSRGQRRDSLGKTHVDYLQQQQQREDDWHNGRVGDYHNVHQAHQAQAQQNSRRLSNESFEANSRSQQLQQQQQKCAPLESCNLRAQLKDILTLFQVNRLIIDRSILLLLSASKCCLRRESCAERLSGFEARKSIGVQIRVSLGIIMALVKCSVFGLSPPPAPGTRAAAAAALAAQSNNVVLGGVGGEGNARSPAAVFQLADRPTSSSSTPLSSLVPALRPPLLPLKSAPFAHNQHASAADYNTSQQKCFNLAPPRPSGGGGGGGQGGGGQVERAPTQVMNMMMSHGGGGGRSTGTQLGGSTFRNANASAEQVARNFRVSLASLDSTNYNSRAAAQHPNYSQHFQQAPAGSLPPPPQLGSTGSAAIGRQQTERNASNCSEAPLQSSALGKPPMMDIVNHFLLTLNGTRSAYDAIRNLQTIVEPFARVHSQNELARELDCAFCLALSGNAGGCAGFRQATTLAGSRNVHSIPIDEVEETTEEQSEYHHATADRLLLLPPPPPPAARATWAAQQLDKENYFAQAAQSPLRTTATISAHNGRQHREAADATALALLNLTTESQPTPPIRHQHQRHQQQEQQNFLSASRKQVDCGDNGNNFTCGDPGGPSLSSPGVSVMLMDKRQLVKALNVTFLGELKQNLVERLHEFTDCAYTKHERRERIVSLLSCIKFLLNKFVKLIYRLRRRMASPSEPLQLGQLRQLAARLMDFCAELNYELQSVVIEQGDELDRSNGERNLLKQMKHFCLVGDTTKAHVIFDEFLEQSEQLIEICQQLNQIAPTNKLKITTKSLCTWFRLNLGQLVQMAACLSEMPRSKEAKDCVWTYIQVWSSFYDDFCQLARQLAYLAHASADPARSSRVAQHWRQIDESRANRDWTMLEQEQKQQQRQAEQEHLLLTEQRHNSWAAPGDSPLSIASVQSLGNVHLGRRLVSPAFSLAGGSSSERYPGQGSQYQQQQQQQALNDSPRSLDHYHGFGPNYRRQHDARHPQYVNPGANQQVDWLPPPSTSSRNSSLMASPSPQFTAEQRHQRQELYAQRQQQQHQQVLASAEFSDALATPTQFDLQARGPTSSARGNQSALFVPTPLGGYSISPLAPTSISVDPTAPPIEPPSVPARRSAPPPPPPSSLPLTTHDHLNLNEPTLAARRHRHAHCAGNSRRRQAAARQQQQQPGRISTGESPSGEELREVEEEEAAAVAALQEDEEDEAELAHEVGVVATRNNKNKVGAPPALDQQSVASSSNLDKWSDSEADAIVRGARETAQMALSMYQFTRGEGDLNTTQDLFTQAELFAEEANELYKEVRCFSYKVPAGDLKKELLCQLSSIPALVQQLQFTVKNPTVGKAATFAKVDSVIRETKCLMEAVNRVVEATLSCRQHYNMGTSSLRKRTRTLSPSYRGDKGGFDFDSFGSPSGGRPGGAFGGPGGGRLASGASGGMGSEPDI